jgi:hypothetical protein
MNTKTAFAVLAAALVAAPLSAQIRPRTDQGRRTADGSVIRSDGSVVRSDGSIVRPDGTVIRTSDGTVSRRSSRIPPGQLPPRGMCRVWIDGVPPGQQPPVTDCATAERNRVANSRVIYGDRQSFPGRANGRNGNQNARTQCVYRDAVVVNGRTVDVCRDANGNIINDRTGRARKGDENDNDDRFDNQKEQEKANKRAAKALKKQGKGNRGRDNRDN